MVQKYSSANTSINSNKLPKAYTKVSFPPNHIILDYGCGRYIEHIRAAVPDTNTYLPFDPFNQPESVNRKALRMVRAAAVCGMTVDVVCSNVLNVIDSADVVRDIADRIMKIVNRTGGTAYITVYEGDRTGNGRPTGKDQYQRNQPLRDYLHLFPGAEIRRGMIVYRKGEC